MVEFCGQLRRIDWGSAPDWIAGVAGALAFLAILAAFLWERRKRHQDEEQAREDRLAGAAQERRAHAEAVTYYLRPGGGADRAAVDAAEFGASTDGLAVGTLVIVNNSKSCVYKLIASVPDLSEGLELRGIGVAPPGETPVSFPMKHMSDSGSAGWRYVGDYANNRLVPWVQFTDGTGVSWRRSNDGTLEEVPCPVRFPDYSP